MQFWGCENKVAEKLARVTISFTLATKTNTSLTISVDHEQNFNFRHIYALIVVKYSLHKKKNNGLLKTEKRTIQKIKTLII